MKCDNVLVVLNYNDQKTTREFVHMAKKCNAIQKIIVVDNCSTDGSYEGLKVIASDKVDVIQSEKNGGYAYGNNFGVKYAVERYSPEVCFISNPDVTFENETIIELQECLKFNKEIAVVAPIVNQGYNIWNLPDYIDIIESLFLVWHTVHKASVKKKVCANSNKLVKVGVVEGSFFAMSIEAYKLVGGFDERTFLYCEENIFAKRLSDANLSVAVLNNIRYNHFHSVSIKKYYKSKARAFKLFYPSFMLYLKEYLCCSKVQLCFFEIAFRIGYFERCIYDIVKKII